MISESHIRDKYQELLFEEFVDAPKLWRVSLKLTNSLIDHLNLLTNQQHKQHTYDEFCSNSIKVISAHLEKLSFHNLYKVEECDVHSANPELASFVNERSYHRLYKEASDEVIKSRILCLEKAIHKACSLDVIKQLAGDQYHELENSIERVYLSSQ
ncbi:MAG: hypothetical protein P8J32_08395 [bacterium]|nr:hypothetical protein [bacterium]